MKVVRGCDKIHAKEVKLTEKRTQPKDFSTRVHSEYNEISTEQIMMRFKKQFFFLFSFLFKI